MKVSLSGDSQEVLVDIMKAQSIQNRKPKLLNDMDISAAGNFIIIDIYHC
jgi:hypothetical protein